MIENEEEKRKLAIKIASKVRDGETIGFGSGTTSYLTAVEIGKRVLNENLKIKAVPTSREIEDVCNQYKIEVTKLCDCNIDWAFDGADEVDENNNLLKGMGRAMFREKLNILSSPITYILIDKSKFVTKIGEKHPIPIEIYNDSEKFVSGELKKIGANKIEEAGMSDNNNRILHVHFENVNESLEKDIKLIPGVIESGLFYGYNVKIVTNDWKINKRDNSFS